MLFLFYLFVIKQDNHEVNNGRYLLPCSLFCCYATDNSVVVKYLERLLGTFATFFETLMKDLLIF